MISVYLNSEKEYLMPTTYSVTCLYQSLADHVSNYFVRRQSPVGGNSDILTQHPVYPDRKMQKTRALVTGCFFLIGCFAYVTGAVSGHLLKVLGAIIFMPLSSFGALWLINRGLWAPPRVTAFTLTVDTLLASWVIYWTGGVMSPCLPFYLTSVMAASFRFGPKGSLFYTVLSIVGYNIVGLLDPHHSHTLHGTAGMMFRIGTLFAAAGFGIGALHQKLERYRRERILRRALEKASQESTKALHDLQAAQNQLLHTEKLASIGRLVAGVAHEINNPVSFVYGNLIHMETYIRKMKSLLAFDEGLIMDKATRDQREKVKKAIDHDYLLEDLDRALQDSRKGAERIRKIVESLLKFSRVRKGTFRRVELREPMENALCFLAAKLNKNINIIREYDPTEIIDCDPEELSQLFLNLLANAIDAVGSSGTVWVKSLIQKTEDQADKIVIVIQDSGPGISPENRQRIFDPFFTTKEVGQGTGLGLSIAYSITQRHKGEISLECPENQGTRFLVSLPRRGS